ncbi:MAG: hypothetical protein WBF17_12565 [Phycisphaerae bacterium]
MQRFFKMPDNPNAVVWRYMDFTKYVAMLDSGGLFFVKVNALAHADPFEGSFWPSQELRENAGSREHAESSAREMLVSCWHRNEGESAAMWRLYLRSDEGVAIRSTFSRLQMVLRDGRVREPEGDGTAPGTPVNGGVGLVEYLDFQTQRFGPRANLFQGVLHKRKCFDHEREVRAVIVPDTRWLREARTGVVLLVSDLNDLILEVYVRPESPRWLTDLVRSVSQKYGLEAPVRRSRLLEFPEGADA